MLRDVAARVARGRVVAVVRDEDAPAAALVVVVGHEDVDVPVRGCRSRCVASHPLGVTLVMKVAKLGLVSTTTAARPHHVGIKRVK
eukprot:1810666-Prymnesium_polylepis.1